MGSSLIGRDHVARNRITEVCGAEPNHLINIWTFDDLPLHGHGSRVGSHYSYLSAKWNVVELRVFTD
jgi:hypothetical protein